ncbi:MAG: VWA domain-containing protein [Synechococcales cyanobacterium]
MKMCNRWLSLGLMVLLWLGLAGCGLQESGSQVPPVDSAATARQVLTETLIPKINPISDPVSDQVASRFAVDRIPDPLPNLEDFPLYGAQPSRDPNVIYLEILTSSEKANADKQNERWLIDVADAFNAQNVSLPSGERIQVGIRKVPSGSAARLLGAQAVEVAGYSPSNDLWVEMVRSQGVGVLPVIEQLVPNVAGFVVQGSVYQELAADGEVTFERFLDRVLGGSYRVGYPNPYTSSTALNLLYSILWQAAGHQQDGRPLTAAELSSPQIHSVFDAFQKQVLITTVTTLDLQEIFIRDPDQLQAFPLEYQNYQTLKQLSGFENVAFIPFGIPHHNPLVGFDWNTPSQQQALQLFGDFATSPAMQQLATAQGFAETDYFQAPGLPPIPSGEVLTAAQTYWKQRKDGGQTVYLMLVIDVSGSMNDSNRLTSVKEGLRIASGQINAGNYVGLVTFSDVVRSVLPLAPFETLHHQRLLAAIDRLVADGGTAMYDGMMVGLAELMNRQQQDPNGRYYLLVLSDGETNRGYGFVDIRDVLAYSGIRVYPIAYGEVNQAEMQAIAGLRESTVQAGTPSNVQTLLKDLFQTNL